MFLLKRKKQEITNESSERDVHTQSILSRQLEVAREEQMEHMKKSFDISNDIFRYVTGMDYVKEMMRDVVMQRESIKNVACSSEELSASIEDISSYINNSLSSTEEAVEASNECIQVINKSFDHMGGAFDKAAEAKKSIGQLVLETQDIDKMVNIIIGVADQTNLLALNASIEAARAGEHGRGFAVVAEEIKKLAESTKESIHYINTVMEGIRSRIDETNKAMDDMEKVFRTGKDSIDQGIASMDMIRYTFDDVKEAFENISSSVEEQTAATEEIAASVHEVDEKARVVLEECQRTGKGFYDIGEKINKVRLGTCSIMEMDDMKLAIECSISDHLNWRWQVYNGILGYSHIDVDKAKDYSCCRLGKWLEEHKEHPLIKEDIMAIHEPHRQLHEEAGRAFEAIAAENTPEAEVCLQKLDRASAKVVTSLEAMKSKL